MKKLRAYNKPSQLGVHVKTFKQTKRLIVNKPRNVSAGVGISKVIKRYQEIQQHGFCIRGNANCTKETKRPP